MKGYRAGIYLVAGLIVAGCQGPATLGGQPGPSPLRTTEGSTEGPGPSGGATPEVTTTTTQLEKSKTTTKKSESHKVLGIPIGYKPEATTIHFDLAYDVFKRKLKEFYPCDDSLCGVAVHRIFVGVAATGDECIVERWEAVNSGNRTIAYNAYIKNPCKKYNPKSPKPPASSVTTSSSSVKKSP